MKKLYFILSIMGLIIFNFQMSFGQLANGSYRFYAKNNEVSPKYMQVKSPLNAVWNNASGLYPLQQHDETFGDDQVFALELVEKDFYKITVVSTGLCLEASSTNGDISVKNYTKIESQKWKLRLNPDGSYWVVNKANQNVLTAVGGDVLKDAGILIKTETLYSNSNIRTSQKFIITPFDYSKKTPGANGNGLTATFNDGQNLQGNTSMTKTVPTVNFDPFTSSIVPTGMPYEGKFSVKIEGQLEAPVSGRFKFFMKVDDNAKVWINNKLVLNQDSYNSEAIFYTNLIKGEKNDIRIEYSNEVVNGSLVCSWEYAGQVKQIIPTKYFYANQIKDGVEIISQTPNQLVVIARDSINSTKLRWVPPSPTSWLKGVVRGYKIERFTTKINGVTQSQPYVKREWEVAAQPKDSPKWASSIITNSNSKNFVNKFQGNTTYLGGMYEVLYGNNTTTLAYRYYTAMLTSNLSYAAAKMAGIGFTDTEASDNSEYIYKVSFLDQTSAIDPGQVIVVTNTGQPDLPEKPVSKFLNKVERVAKPTDKCNGIDCDSIIVALSWNTKVTQKFYGSYWLDRKINPVTVGGTPTFERVNKFPFISLTKVDSVITSDTISYYNPSSSTYRVIGRSYFDEEFISPELTFTYTPPFEFIPEIIKSRFITDASKSVNAYVKWIFPNESKFLPSDLPKIKGMVNKYQIEKSDNPNDGFILLMDDIAITKDSIILKNGVGSQQNLQISKTIYVRVIAVNASGKKTYSSSVMLMPNDTIPPAKPRSLTAQLSTDKKRVVLTWVANTEPDFWKYAIFRKNSSKDIYWNKISKKDTNLITYTDTLKLDVDSDKLWYGLVAIDKRGNYSVMDSAFVIRPDVKPPIAPVFLRYVRNVDDTNVRIDWNLGDLNDIKEYALYRNNVAGCPVEGWTALKTVLTKPLPSDTTITDSDIVKGKKYCYNIIVKDQANLSTSSQPLIIDIPKTVSRNAINTFTATFIFDDKKTDVTWLYPSDPDLSSFELMRSETNLKDFTSSSKYEPYSSWKILTANNVMTIDNDVIFNGKYSYAIRALFKDGTVTAWKEFNLTTPIGCKAGKLQITRNQKVTEFKVFVDKACDQIVLEPGFDSELLEYEAMIEKK
jgi:uncharacterized protein